jgi:hypothetical protein
MKKHLTIVFLGFLFAIGAMGHISFAHADLTTGIQSYWKMDESSGNAADSVGSSDLTNTNVTYSSGKINNASVYNGSSAVLSSSDVSGSDSWTANLWINVSVKQGSYILSKDGSGNRAFVINMGGDGTIEVDAWNSSETQYSAYEVGYLSTGTWYMITAVWDSSAETLSLYADTTLLNSVSITGTAENNSSSAFYVGGHPAGGDNWYDGYVDEVGYWDRALNGSEIDDLYNSGAGLQYPVGGTPPPPPPTVDMSLSQFFYIASSTCEQTNTSGTTTYACTGTTTMPIVPYGDWLIVSAIMIACMAFIPISTLMSMFALRRKR